MPSRVLSLYSVDELTKKARYLRDQIDAGATTINNGLGPTASYISIGAARRLIDELMDEIGLRQGVKPPPKTRVTQIIPVSGYGSCYRPGPGRGFGGF